MQIQPGQSRSGQAVASVAIRRRTGGCEAYTASKQAARDELRNWSDRDADAMLLAESSIRHAVMRGVFGIAGVAARPGRAMITAGTGELIEWQRKGLPNWERINSALRISLRSAARAIRLHLIIVILAE